MVDVAMVVANENHVQGNFRCHRVCTYNGGYGLSQETIDESITEGAGDRHTDCTYDPSNPNDQGCSTSVGVAWSILTDNIC